MKLPGTTPGKTFELVYSPDGKLILEALPTSLNLGVHLEKTNGFTVIVSDTPLDMAALKRFLDEFP